MAAQDHKLSKHHILLTMGMQMHNRRLGNAGNKS